MKYYYDLHIHTALSPCSDDDMTPNNIVNMAKLKGLDVIAITDHNSAKNVAPVIECSRNKDLIVIPGMEIESSEEVHLLCLFSNLENAVEMSHIVNKHLPNIKNKAQIFGNQIIYNSKDEIVEYESQLLMTATSLSLDIINNLVKDLKGVVIPSHIDRNSYSIISNLGFIPDEYQFKTLEISKGAKMSEFINRFSYLQKYRLITNSDSHNLGEISERINSFDLKDLSIKSILDFLKI